MIIQVLVLSVVFLFKWTLWSEELTKKVKLAKPQHSFAITRFLQSFKYGNILIDAIFSLANYTLIKLQQRPESNKVVNCTQQLNEENLENKCLTSIPIYRQEWQLQ